MSMTAYNKALSCPNWLCTVKDFVAELLLLAIQTFWIQSFFLFIFCINWCQSMCLQRLHILFSTFYCCQSNNLVWDCKIWLTPCCMCSGRWVWWRTLTKTSTWRTCLCTRPTAKRRPSTCCSWVTPTEWLLRLVSTYIYIHLYIHWGMFWHTYFP